MSLLAVAELLVFVIAEADSLAQFCIKREFALGV
jgi:hypothetical protein